jgi:hypothetical protein
MAASTADSCKYKHEMQISGKEWRYSRILYNVGLITGRKNTTWKHLL